MGSLLVLFGFLVLAASYAVSINLWCDVIIIFADLISSSFFPILFKKPVVVHGMCNINIHNNHKQLLTFFELPWLLSVCLQRYMRRVRMKIPSLILVNLLIITYTNCIILLRKRKTKLLLLLFLGSKANLFEGDILIPVSCRCLCFVVVHVSRVSEACS